MERSRSYQCVSTFRYTNRPHVFWTQLWRHRLEVKARSRVEPGKLQLHEIYEKNIDLIKSEIIPRDKPLRNSINQTKSLCHTRISNNILNQLVWRLLKRLNQSHFNTRYGRDMEKKQLNFKFTFQYCFGLYLML